MSFAQYEAVALLTPGVLRVIAQDAVIEHPEYIQRGMSAFIMFLIASGQCHEAFDTRDISRCHCFVYLGYLRIKFEDPIELAYSVIGNKTMTQGSVMDLYDRTGIFTQTETLPFPLVSTFHANPHNLHLQQPQIAQSNLPATHGRHNRQDAS